MSIPAGALARMRRYVEGLERSEWWPPEEMQRWQRRRLARLVTHARKHVPYYAEHLRGFPLADATEVDEAAWRTIPLLSKAAVRTEGERLKSSAHGPGGLIDRATSGSTGEPLRLVKEGEQWLFFAAIKLRFLRSLGTDFSAKLLDIRLPPPGSRNAVRRHLKWEAPASLLYQTGEWVRASALLEPLEQAELLEREQPKYLYLNPTNLRLLLRRWRADGRRRPNLRYVRTAGEQLDPGLRTECREVFGARVFDIYGSAEGDFIAADCPAHDHYHVLSEHNFVEVVTPEGRPCRAGETGRVLLTPLHLFAMPLLRYDTGDYAEVGERCPCGRGLPVLKRVLGKEYSLFTLPSGEKRIPTAASHLFARMPGVMQFQMAQVAPLDIEVRLVATCELQAAERARIVAAITNQLGAQFTVRIKLVDSIARLPGGKYMEFIDQRPR